LSQGSPHRSRSRCFPYPSAERRLAAAPPVSCAGLKLSMNFIASDIQPFSHAPLVFSGCKSTTFLITGKHFFQLFSITITITLIIKRKKINLHQFLS